MSVVSVIGRWASLDNGDLVTAIPPRSEYGTESAFNIATREFQRDPEAFLSRHALVQRIPAWKSSRELRATYNQERDPASEPLMSFRGGEWHELNTGKGEGMYIPNVHDK